MFSQVHISQKNRIESRRMKSVEKFNSDRNCKFFHVKIFTRKSVTPVFHKSRRFTMKSTSFLVEYYRWLLLNRLAWIWRLIWRFLQFPFRLSVTVQFDTISLKVFLHGNSTRSVDKNNFFTLRWNVHVGFWLFNVFLYSRFVFRWNNPESWSWFPPTERIDASIKPKGLTLVLFEHEPRFYEN